MKDCQLVMIEWEDSAQPLPNLSYLADFVADRAVLCTSVGWLIGPIQEKWRRPTPFALLLPRI